MKTKTNKPRKFTKKQLERAVAQAMIEWFDGFEFDATDLIETASADAVCELMDAAPGEFYWSRKEEVAVQKEAQLVVQRLLDKMVDALLQKR